ncbi:MAG: Smr/MutS family protein [Lewinellaceae bacterium]|nr:Smr/MutS family protein [Saprospiraceae bacterium]MCB9340284.1 Smr/MutS family protein [Lewinellaceae bacterium]
MLFAVGTKVKFLHTGDEGIVKSLLEGGMVNVYIQQYDMEIPAHTDDLMRAERNSPKPVKAKIVEGKKTPPPPEPPPVPIETQYTILKSYGIQLALEPVFDQEGLVEKYNIFLLNDTSYDVVYTIKFLLNYKRPESWNGKLKSVSFVKLGEMLYDDLNEAPEFEVECSWITTEGVGEPIFKALKIKAKSFFNTQRTAPFLNKPAHLYRLFEKPENPADDKTEDLGDYTKRHSKPGWQLNPSTKIDPYDSAALAAFVPEIDLHIEKLADDWKKMSNAEILRIQLSRFDAYLNEAIRLGVPQVFIIHGVGQGRLRDEIATRLMQNPDVQTFKNEYHHKYGWGATEVLL